MGICYGAHLEIGNDVTTDETETGCGVWNPGVGRFRERRFYVFLFASVVALAITCVLAAQADAPSAQPTPEYFQKVAQQLAMRVEVYYFTWHAFTYAAIKEPELVTDSWTGKSTLKFPTVTALAEELAAMKLEPLKERSRDFRLACIVTFNENEKPVTVSFAKYRLRLHKWSAF